MSLTLEQMRQDLAKILLEDPADIHDDDNLIDLGLDSMRAMTRFFGNGRKAHAGCVVGDDFGMTPPWPRCSRLLPPCLQNRVATGHAWTAPTPPSR